MPKFTVPKPKKKKNGEIDPRDEYYNRNVYLPANSEIIEALEIGKKAVIKLTGTVKMLEERSSEGGTRAEFQVEVEEIEAYEDGGFEDLAIND